MNKTIMNPMKSMMLIIAAVISSCHASSAQTSPRDSVIAYLQEMSKKKGSANLPEYVKGKGYKGYVFPKEHAILGFPPERYRYTPSQKDIAQAEKILKDSIGTNYVTLNQKQWKKPPINRKTLKKYVRQYVGYLTENNDIVICIYLNKDMELYKNKLSEDIIFVNDAGDDHWRICINLFTRELYGMSVNGTS